MFMNRIANKERAENRQIVRFFAAVIISLSLTCLICAMLAPTIYAASTPQVTLTAEQIIVNNGPSIPPRTTFTYRLIPKTMDAPMPHGSGSEGYVFTISGNEERPIGPISFSAPGIFTYELSCIAGGEFGLAMDRRVHAVEVHVTNDLQITTVVYISAGTKLPTISFEHAYPPFSGGTEGAGKPGGQDGAEGPEQPDPSEQQSKPETPEQPDPESEPEMPVRPETTGQIEVPGIGPSTGDFSNPNFWMALIVISSTLLFLIVYLDRKLRERRNN
jgi:hypothetical protein